MVTATPIRSKKLTKCPCSKYRSRRKSDNTKAPKKPRLELANIIESVKNSAKKTFIKKYMIAPFVNGSTQLTIEKTPNHKMIVSRSVGKKFLRSLTSFFLYLIFLFIKLF